MTSVGLQPQILEKGWCERLKKKPKKLSACRAVKVLQYFGRAMKDVKFGTFKENNENKEMRRQEAWPDLWACTGLAATILNYLKRREPWCRHLGSQRGKCHRSWAVRKGRQKIYHPKNSFILYLSMHFHFPWGQTALPFSGMPHCAQKPREDRLASCYCKAGACSQSLSAGCWECPNPRCQNCHSHCPSTPDAVAFWFATISSASDRSCKPARMLWGSRRR